MLAGRGDEAAAEAFVRRTLPDVRRFCVHLVGPVHADDAVQATYLRALRAARRFRGESSARTWLLGVARHTCLDELRSGGRRTRLQKRIETERPAEAVHDRPPAHEEHLRFAVRSLDLPRREAFVLTQVLGYSYEEAAAVAGCPIGTIRSRVARARMELQVALGAAPPAGAAVAG
jgi:RNA polymerase sigma-70 factor (ECF subfamily)